MPSGGTRPLTDLLLFCTRKSVALPLTMLACFLSLASLDRLVLENMVPGKEMLEKFSRPISVFLRAWLPQKNPLL